MFTRLIFAIICLQTFSISLAFSEEGTTKKLAYKYAFVHVNGEIQTGEIICYSENKRCEQSLGNGLELSITDINSKTFHVRVVNEEYPSCCILSGGKERQVQINDNRHKVFQINDKISQTNLFDNGFTRTTLNRQRGFIGKLTLISQNE